MVDALAADGSDQPLGKTVLPWRAWRDGLVADTHGSYSARDGSTVDRIAIADEVAARDHLSPQAAIAAKSRRRLCRLHGRADRGELIGSQRLLREQQAGAFVKIGTARAQDVGRPAEGLRHQVAPAVGKK